MKSNREHIPIASTDYWFKVVEMLQQNWALIDPLPDGGVLVWFLSDASGVFDEMQFPSKETAMEALIRNGFDRLAHELQAQQFLAPPVPPYTRCQHPKGPIYSSGRFWR